MRGIFVASNSPGNHKKWGIIGLSIIAGLVILLATCARMSSPARHGVSGKELRKTMKTLDRHTSEDLYEVLGMNAPAGMSKIVNTAEEIAKTAEYIPKAIETLDLDESAKEDFARLAGQLRDQALELAAGARANDLPQAKESMASIKTTCNECHETYRLSDVSQ